MERPPRDELPFLLDDHFDQVDKKRVAQLSTNRMLLLGVSLFQDPRSFNTLESGAYTLIRMGTTISIPVHSTKRIGRIFHNKALK